VTKREGDVKPFAIGCVVLVLVAVAVAGLMTVGSYNRLVAQEEGVTSAWAQVENAYQRRADLIPNLVETVKGARDFEQDTLTAVVEARARVGEVRIGGAPDAAEMVEFQAAQGELSSALSRLLMVVESYPQLKATDAFRDLQVQLEGTENRIAVERRRFNEAAQAFNTSRRTFPTVLIANLFGFAEKTYFEAESGAERPPQVDFSG
jgi:LemA protein